MHVQEMYISAHGQKVLMNGGKSVNYIGMQTTDYSPYMQGIKTLSSNYTLKISTLDEMQNKLHIATTVSNKLDRFSLVNIRGQDGGEICLILDSGASTSTICSLGAERFYHVIMEHPVLLKTATGETTFHKEAIIAMPMKDRASHLAISFLLVEHRFDNIPSVGTEKLADGLYTDYLERCTSKNIKAFYNRKDFPDQLDSRTPCGLLGVRDFQLNLVASFSGVLALENIFDSETKLILAGPLPKSVCTNISNFAQNCSRQVTVNSITDKKCTEYSSNELKSKISTWLSKRRNLKNRKMKIGIIKPRPRIICHNTVPISKYEIASTLKSLGNHLLNHMSTNKLYKLLMTMGDIVLRHVWRHANNDNINPFSQNFSPLGCGNCVDTNCIHCILNRVLISNDIETNPGPQMTPLGPEWEKSLGYVGLKTEVDSENLLCFLNSIHLVMSGKERYNFKSVPQLKKRTRILY
jgi:hypothetical protein